MGREYDIPDEEIARRAYENWESGGRPQGDGTQIGTPSWQNT